MSAAVTRHYLSIWREHTEWLEKHTHPSGKYKHFSKVTFELTEEQLIMARTRGVKTDGNTRGQTQPIAGRSNAPVRWLNVNLTDDDAAFLAESDATLDQLAAMACSMVVRGYSLTIKPMDGGGSVMACIVGQSSTHPDVNVGLSGFSDNVRDALLVLCYKFEDKLARQLPLPDGDATNSRPRFR